MHCCQILQIALKLQIWRQGSLWEVLAKRQFWGKADRTVKTELLLNHVFQVLYFPLPWCPITLLREHKRTLHKDMRFFSWRSSPPASRRFFLEWDIIILNGNEKMKKKSTSEKKPGRDVIKDWHFYLVCKIKFSIFIHSLKNNLFSYRWVGIILSVLSAAKDSGDWTWKWAPHISQIYDYFFLEICLEEYHGTKPWIERGCSRMSYPNERRVREIAGGLLG